MKKLTYLLLALLTFSACEKESSNPYIWTVDTKQAIVFDNQGKASLSCTIVPTNTDISQLEIADKGSTRIGSDGDWSGFKVMSATKDTQTPGKWNVTLALTSTTGNQLTPKPEHRYYVKATRVHFFLDGVGNSNEFGFEFDINPNS